ncbi:MAG: hypothetical protein OK454_09170, partial [Thaumarchaeota archaeon]|nr:hypothetical protein [Nitrososphaerota archaeon]
MKKECLEELESGWLVQLVCDDTEDEALFARTRGDKFAAPHSAAVDDMDGDIEMDLEDEESKLWAL